MGGLRITAEVKPTSRWLGVKNPVSSSRYIVIDPHGDFVLRYALELLSTRNRFSRPETSHSILSFIRDACYFTGITTPTIIQHKVP